MKEEREKELKEKRKDRRDKRGTYLTLILAVFAVDPRWALFLTLIQKKEKMKSNDTWTHNGEYIDCKQ